MIIIGVDYHPEFQQIAFWTKTLESSRRNGFLIQRRPSSSIVF